MKSKSEATDEKSLTKSVRISRWFPKWSRPKVTKKVDDLEKKVLKGTEKFVIDRWQKIREVRTQIIIWCSLVLTILLAVILQVMFSQRGYRTMAMVGGGTYREGLVGEIKSLNPLYASSESEKAVSQLVFSRLLQYDLTGSLKNDLAKSVTVSNDGLIYSVTIRDDVKWHDGEPLTAKDVKFTVDTMKNSAVNSSLGSMWRGINIKQVGDYSLDFVLPAAYSPFRSALNFAILPEHILSQVELARLREAEFSFAPVGSGPMKFQSLRTMADAHGGKQILHLITNSDYYADKPQIGRFEFHVFQNNDGLYESIRSHEIDAAANVAYQKIIDKKGWNFQASDTQNSVFAFFNNDRDFLKPIEIRIALRAIIDLKSIRSEFNLEHGSFRALDEPILSSHLNKNEVEPKNWLNHDQASTILQERGYVLRDEIWYDAADQPIKLSVVTVKGANYAKLAEMLVSAWRDFGILAELTAVDLTDQNTDFVRSYLQSRDYDVLVYEIELGSDPDQFVYWHSSQKSINGLNLANYGSTTVDVLLATARSSGDIDLRKAKYQSFVEYWLNEAPAIGLVRSKYGYAINDSTQTFRSGSVLSSPQSRFFDLGNFLVEQNFIYTTP
ncbi:MAG: peptide ABC transporter substrate-binding protein [Candidatus Nanosyncoccaceae bacterium]|jgi:peptide/nickel transport system substrate-binding protein